MHVLSIIYTMSRDWTNSLHWPEWEEITPMSLELQQDKQGIQTFSAAPMMYLQLQNN